MKPKEPKEKENNLADFSDEASEDSLEPEDEIDMVEYYYGDR